MEIRNLHYDARSGAYQAQVCLHHAGRIVSVPAKVKAHKSLRPALISEILAHRAQRAVDRTAPTR